MKRLILCLSVVSTGLWAQVQTFSGQGNVNWGTRTVTAVGIGAPNPVLPAVAARPAAIRAARDIALRNALEIIKGIQLSSATTVANHMLENDVVRTQVSGFIRSFQESEPKYMNDKTIEITVTIPLDGDVSNTLLPKEVQTQPKAISVGSQAVNKNFTGLIIDARGFKVLPALSPQIFDESGKEVYGSAYVAREFAIKWGMVGYAKSPEQASTLKDRIGENPGIIKAKESKIGGVDLVISTTDAMEVVAATKGNNFLADCRVIVIVD